MKRRALIIIISLFMVMGCFQRKSITGTFKMIGKSQGKPYTGTLTIYKRGDVYQLGWELKSGETYDGIGILEEGYLAGAYSDAEGNIIGAVLYKVEKDALTGIWATPGGEENFLSGTEIAFKKEGSQPEEYVNSPLEEDIEGEYVVEGKNPDGTEYTARVKIVRMGDFYGIMWESRNNYFYGVGIPDGKRMAVGWFAENKEGKSEDTGFGVAFLKIKSPHRINATWGIWGVNEKGTEKWVRLE